MKDYSKDFKSLNRTIEIVNNLRKVVFGEQYRAKTKFLTKREIRKFNKFMKQYEDTEFTMRNLLGEVL